MRIVLQFCKMKKSQRLVAQRSSIITQNSQKKIPERNEVLMYATM